MGETESLSYNLKLINDLSTVVSIVLQTLDLTQNTEDDQMIDESGKFNNYVSPIILGRYIAFVLDVYLSVCHKS